MSLYTVNYGRGLRLGSAPDRMNITNLTNGDALVLTQMTVNKVLDKHGTGTNFLEAKDYSGG